ncbi:uncharacterized protein LOC135806453 [Sycon ciliatum]|uniref:uncharacterized protein LOC135806453 n=1 Tax=Sycon ciliatum TaxID=27933 RepID=UPI0031F7166D
MSQDFAVILSEWLEKEMEYGGPVTSDMLSRMAHGRASGMFRHLVKKVHSKRTVETVLGNLSLHSNTKQARPSSLHLCPPPPSTMSTSERQKLLSKRERLQQQVQHLKSTKKQLALDLSLLRNTLTEKESEVAAHRSRISECRHQTCVLEQQSLSAGQQLHTLNEMCSQIRTIITNQQEKQKAGSSTQYSTSGADGVLESIPLQETRTAVQETKEFLFRYYQGQSSERSHLDMDKHSVWSKVESLWNKYPPATIISSLQSLADEHAQLTTQQTSNIDLKADSDKLRLQGSSTSSPTIANSLQNLIQTSQVEHINQFTTTQKLLCQAREQEQHLQSLLQQYHERQQRALSSQPHLLATSRSSITSEVEKVGLQAELQQWQSALRQNKEKCHRRRQEREDLLAVHQQISSFTADVEKNQTLISDLIQYNSSAFDRLSEQQTKIRQYAARSLSSHHSDLTSSCAVLRDQLLESSRAVLKLSLNRLLVDNSDRSSWCPVEDLSIHRMLCSTTSGANRHQAVLQLLRYPQFKCSDGLLQHVCQLIESNVNASRHLTVLSAACKKASSKQQQQLMVSDHLQMATSLDNSDRTELVPQLTSSGKHCTDTLSKCVITQQLIEEWCEQPAQFTVPWSTYHSQSLQQWTEQFIVLATKWHQKKLLQ